MQCLIPYSAGRKFGESSMICQSKTIQISTYNYNLLAKSIHSPNFFAKCSKQVNLPNFIPAKLSCYTVTQELARCVFVSLQ